MRLSNDDKRAIQQEYCSRRLVNFVKQAWSIFDPTSPYVHGFHIDAICEHLEAITRGDITRLLINIPPGCMKSSLVNILWPAWEWGPCGKPHHRIISASHALGLSTRDTRAMRRVIQSDWYQSLWPIEIASDQNQKTYYENDATGFRQACAVSSMTGVRGHRVLWDDPLSAENANSETHRETVVREFQETLPSRFVDQRTSANVIVMQRLHERDPAGFILENELDYEHLCLPMEFEPERKCVTSIGFEDPRTESGQLLFPERFPAETVERDKKVMTEYAVAGQFQQRPAPRGGGMFKVKNINILNIAPRCRKTIRYWDKAGTQDGGACTAGVKMGLMEDNSVIVLDVVRGQWSAGEREQRIKQTAQIDGIKTQVWVEQEPGSGGKESAESTVRNLAGFDVRAEPVTGEKEIRAEPYAAQMEGANVYLLKGEWNRAFIDEHETFPAGQYKDQVDAASGAFNKLVGQGISILDVVD